MKYLILMLLPISVSAKLQLSVVYPNNEIKYYSLTQSFNDFKMDSLQCSASHKVFEKSENSALTCIVNDTIVGVVKACSFEKTNPYIRVLNAEDSIMYVRRNDKTYTLTLSCK